MRHNIYYILLILLLITSCSGGKKATKSDPRYQRKPIVEVTEDELKVDAQFIDAKSQQLTGKGKESMASLRKIVAEHPDYAAASYELGKMMLAMGWTDSALYYARQASRLDGDNLWYQLLLARTYEKQQDGKSLIATWERIIQQHPDEEEYYYNLSNAYLMVDDIPGSIAALDRYEKRFGLSEPVSLQKQKLWAAVNRPDKARKELERLADAMPGDTRYGAIIAQSYMEEHNYDKALAYYNKVLAAAPDDENIHIALAECHIARKDYRQAFVHLRQGLHHPALDCKTRMTYLSEFLRDSLFFEAAAESCFRLADTLASGCPADDGHCLAYGLMLAGQQRYKEAAQQLSAHLEQDPQQYIAWEALLLCEQELEDHLQQLIAHAQRVTELFPLMPRPYLVLARGYQQLGECQQAVANADRCQMLAPRDKDIQQQCQAIKQQCQ